jgi:hypothetical protein
MTKRPKVDGLPPFSRRKGPGTPMASVGGHAPLGSRPRGHALSSARVGECRRARLPRASPCWHGPVRVFVRARDASLRPVANAAPTSAPIDGAQRLASGGCWTELGTRADLHRSRRRRVRVGGTHGIVRRPVGRRVRGVARGADGGATWPRDRVAGGRSRGSASASWGVGWLRIASGRLGGRGGRRRGVRLVSERAHDEARLGWRLGAPRGER